MLMLEVNQAPRHQTIQNEALAVAKYPRFSVYVKQPTYYTPDKKQKTCWKNLSHEVN